MLAQEGFSGDLWKLQVFDVKQGNAAPLKLGLGPKFSSPLHELSGPPIGLCAGL